MSELCGRLRDGLEGVGATVLSDGSEDGRSGIVSFWVEGLDPTLLSGALRGEGIVCAPRAGAVRVSPHGYNTADEIDALVAAVAARR